MAEESKKKNTGRIILIIILIVLLLAGAATGIYFGVIKKDDKKLSDGSSSDKTTDSSQFPPGPFDPKDLSNPQIANQDNPAYVDYLKTLATPKVGDKKPGAKFHGHYYNDPCMLYQAHKLL